MRGLTSIVVVEQLVNGSSTHAGAIMPGPASLQIMRQLVVIVFVSACGDAPAAQVAPFHDRLIALGATPCDTDPSFLCGTIDVPADHANPAGPMQPFAFAGRAAVDTISHGVLLSIAGGPGFSGINEIDDWTTTDASIPSAFDLLTFDLRGVARSTTLDCPDASSAWYSNQPRGSTAQARDALVARATAYAADCAVEAGFDTSRLSLYATAQATEDLEALRDALAIDAMVVYGLSYGTQLAQAYATAHPDHTRAIVLDGVIDLMRGELDYATSLQTAITGILDRTLAACATDVACVADLGTDAGASYDELAAMLATTPSPVGTRMFTRADLDAVSVLAVDNPEGRTALLQALGAAHTRANFAPFRTLLDGLANIDAATGTVQTGPFSDAIYYTFTANDYGRPVNGAGDYLAAAAPILAANPRTIEAFFGDLPTSIWPGAPATLSRPGAFAPGAPVLLIDADADAATPVVQGRAVLAAARAVGNPIREVAVSGGHHVMAADSDCVDAEIVAFLFDPVTDAARADVACSAPFVLPYTTNLPHALHRRVRQHRSRERLGR